MRNRFTKITVALGIAAFLVVPLGPEPASGCQVCTQVSVEGEIRSDCGSPGSYQWGYEMCEVRWIPRPRNQAYYCVLSGYQCLYVEVR